MSDQRVEGEEGKDIPMTEISPTGGQRPRAEEPLRGSGRSSRLGRALAVVGGMRPDLVDEFPGQRRHFAQMAMLLFVSSLEAFLSGALAVGLLFPSPDEPPALWVLLLGGLLWGIVIFVINRMLVLSMEGRRRTRALVPALIGVLLSTLLGGVMATPLMLQLFQPEVEAKVASLNQERALAGRDVLQPFDEAVARATDEVDKRRQELELARSGYSLEGDPAYQAAVVAWKQASEACTQAQAKATRELRGELPPSEGGSGTPGASASYRALQAQADAACKLADEKARDVDAAKAAAQRTPEQTAESVKAAEDAIAVAEANLDQALQARDHARERYAQAAEGHGLLIRLEALDALQRDNPTGALTQYALMALLASIEVLPVLYKLLTQWDSAPTAYELFSREPHAAPNAPSTDSPENPRV